MKNQNNKTAMIVMTGLMTAVTAVLAQLSIPLPSNVPITLQTFAAALCGYVLGAKYGVISILVYILLGACGMPVFTGFTGGPSKLVGLTGGFIWGFIFLSLLCGLFSRTGALASALRKKSAFTVRALALFSGMAGLAVCHLLGGLQYGILSGISLGRSLMLVSVPYLAKDIASVAAAYMLSLVINRALGNLKTFAAKGGPTK